MVKKKLDDKLPKADYQGTLKIGKKVFNCAVLNDGTRVIPRSAIFKAFGRTRRGRKKGELRAPNLPPFIDAKNLVPYIQDDLRAHLDWFVYKNKSGSQTKGYKAEILPLLCDVYLSARKDGALTTSQQPLAEASEILVRSLSKLGIIALVDEATGYQKEKNEYQKILQLYIAKEIQPWIHTFEDNYYKQLYRLQGWDWDAFKTKRKNHPQYIGKLTNRLIYEKLAPGVLEELKRINPKNTKGNRKTKHFQRLTENVGYRELLKLLSAVTILMEQFEDGDLTGAIQKIDARFPSFSPIYQTTMDFPMVANKERFDTAIKMASKSGPVSNGKGVKGKIFG